MHGRGSQPARRVRLVASAQTVCAQVCCSCAVSTVALSRHSIAVASGYCTACGTNTFSTTAGSTSCASCPTNSISNAGATQCTCATGFYSATGFTTSAACTGTCVSVRIPLVSKRARPQPPQLTDPSAPIVCGARGGHPNQPAPTAPPASRARAARAPVRGAAAPGRGEGGRAHLAAHARASPTAPRLIISRLLGSDPACTPAAYRMHERQVQPDRGEHVVHHLPRQQRQRRWRVAMHVRRRLLQQQRLHHQRPLHQYVLCDDAHARARVRARICPRRLTLFWRSGSVKLPRTMFA